MTSSSKNTPSTEAQQYDPKGEHVNILTRYADKCDRLGIEHHAILGVAEHVGTLVCQAVAEKGIDLVVLGRRKFGSFERLFAGSTSRYCLENCVCNVLVVKDDLPQEVHADIAEVVEATERERQRRIRQEEIVEVHSDLGQVRKLEEQERQRRILEMCGGTPEELAKKEKFEADLRKNIVIMAEEEERQRRIREEEALDMREKIERQMAVQSAIIAEEKEQQRRIQEEKELDKSEELQRLINQKSADLMEEKERERRLAEETPVFIDRKLQVELLGTRS
jgi:hypothetical protein